MNGSPARERLTVSWSERIAGGPASAGVVRELLTRRVGDAVSEERLHDVLLLATELVTNAVLHACVGEDDTLELHVSGQAGRLRVSVADPGGATRPQVQDLDPAVPGGMGLFLVEQISDRWGVQRRLGAAGSDVWFEVTRS